MSQPKEIKEMFQFSVHNFSSKEIDQICELVKRWAKGDACLPVDARKLTKQVKEYALHWNLLERREGRLYITTGYAFNVCYSLPIEALWRLVQPMLKEGITGYSIVNSPMWMALGIAPQNNRFATEQELHEKEHILLELSAHHYINFQMAGSIWRIDREERAA
jgi:hypothetical protein